MCTKNMCCFAITFCKKLMSTYLKKKIAIANKSGDIFDDSVLGHGEFAWHISAASWWHFKNETSTKQKREWTTIGDNNTTGLLCGDGARSIFTWSWAPVVGHSSSSSRYKITITPPPPPPHQLDWTDTHNTLSMTTTTTILSMCCKQQLQNKYH